VRLAAVRVGDPSVGFVAYYDIKYDIRFYCQFIVNFVVELRFAEDVKLFQCVHHLTFVSYVDCFHYVFIGPMECPLSSKCWAKLDFRFSEMLSEPGFKGYTGLSYVPLPACGADQLVDSANVIFLFGVVTSCC
jgi:hypothetical protein